MSISGVYIETIMNFPYRMDGWRSNEVELSLMRDIFFIELWVDFNYVEFISFEEFLKNV